MLLFDNSNGMKMEVQNLWKKTKQDKKPESQSLEIVNQRPDPPRPKADFLLLEAILECQREQQQSKPETV